ncbi:MAG TPA: cytochrome C [Acidobacteriota bacterium]|nr:cytochrome C [Acidobacteriota bacterium]
MRTMTVAVGITCILFVSFIAAKTGTITPGEMIYREGKMASGSPLVGERESGGSVSGREAACVNCHRPSGLGMAEGQIVIPPITSRYLFKPGVLITSTEESDHARIAPTGRPAYTDATLGRAIREGIGPDNRKFTYLMPRFSIDEASMRSLIEYLRNLSSGPVPGVTADSIQFATIITPDADPVKREGMLSVLKPYFASQKRFYRGESPQLLSSWRIMYRVQRMWELHVWELNGPPESWKEQLRKRLREEPVFAVISGMGGKNWAPVHQFCQEESLPCLFPNVDLPVIAEDDFYNVYFSKGVLLEAQLIAQRIRGTAAETGVRRILQICRKNDIGVAAADALHDALNGHGIATREFQLDPTAVSGDLAAALGNAGDKDAVVLWLRPDDLKSLGGFPSAKPAVFVSGLMGGLNLTPLQGEWRSAAHLAYPFELPEKRGVLMDYPLGWFRIERIPLVAEQTQIDTFVACGILAESLKHMLDNFVRDYLLEKLEGMLSSRIINGNYTRLGLAPGQRFASKGGYIVRFSPGADNRLIPEGPWMIP